MAGFALSPGVQVVETDLTNIVPAVSTSIGAYAGAFKWGPVMTPTTVSSERELLEVFGSPDDESAVTFLTAANFLGYSNNLLVTRIEKTGARNASAAGTIVINNEEDYDPSSGNMFAARYPGKLGNAIRVVLIDSGNFAATSSTYKSFVDAAPTGSEMHVLVMDHSGAITGTAGALLEKFQFCNKLSDAKYADGSTAYYVDVINTQSKWVWWLSHPVISTTTSGGVVQTATLSGSTLSGMTPGTYPIPSASIQDPPAGGSEASLSLVVTSATEATISIVSGGSFYTGPITVNGTALGALAGGSGGATVTTTVSAVVVNTSEISWGTGSAALAAVEFYKDLINGADATNFTEYESDKMRNAYVLYADSDKYNINLIITGKVTGADAKWIAQNIAEVRDPKDCIVFVSPWDETANKPYIGNQTSIADLIVTWKTTTFNYNESYAVVDSGYKYQYDRYNDKYRWVPLNADIAGVCARTDNTTDPWFSPAGFTRGQIKNVVKLAHNPNKTARDNLYKGNVNPVVTFSGQGTVLYGDKTAQTRPSAFDRINVRRLFNVLEKAISVSARAQLFEFNDQFTRAQFRSVVEPYLRDVQGRRGITDFRVVCDETNNSTEVIESNRFIADIYIKPSRSINFITLNFVATRAGVTFQEIGG